MSEADDQQFADLTGKMRAEFEVKAAEPVPQALKDLVEQRRVRPDRRKALRVGGRREGEA